MLQFYNENEARKYTSQ